MRTISVVLLCFLAPVLVFSNQKPTSISFSTNSDGLMILPATLGGTIPIHVILDSGAGLDVFAPSLIEKLHGKPAGQFSGFRMTGERLDIPLFVISQLAVGPVVKRDVVVGSWDLLDKVHFDGIISLHSFPQQPFTIDFINKVVVFETPKTLAKRLSEGKSSPLQFDDQRGIALSPFAHFLLGGHTGQCEVDTGSPSATLSTRYMETLGIAKDGKDVQKHEGRTIAGANEMRYESTVASVSLEASPEVSLTKPRVSFSDIIYDCVVGVDFWSGKLLTFDIARGRLIVAIGTPSH